MADKKKIDEASGLETTGHEWDGIAELDRPLPRWWLWTWYATILYSIVYWVLMPSWPGVTGYFGGLIGNSERANVVRDLAELDARRSQFIARLGAAQSLQEIEADPDLLQFAIAAGESAFGDNCATCHGSGAQGAIGYPNLNDDAWIWGGSLDDIKTTLQYGIRSGHPRARNNIMPAYGRDGLLQPEQIDDLTQYVLHLSGREADAEAVRRAEPIFAQQCAACHGPDGSGIRELGGPDLTDAIWLYGGEEAQIRSQIWNARAGVMPFWEGRLDDWIIDALAVYIHTLGGGE